MSLPAIGEALDITPSPKPQSPSTAHPVELADKLSKLRCESSTPPPGKPQGPSITRETPRAVQINRTQPDSGYVSLVSTPNSKKSLPLPSDPRLKIFNKAIPPSLQVRFNDWRLQYTDSLTMAVFKKENRTDISMKLKYMGEAESEAQLYILVQSEKNVSKYVKRFFCRKDVLEELKPHFRVHIMSGALTRHSTKEDIWVRGDLENPGNALCGLAIRMSTGDASTMATLGGLIMVTTTQKTLYGLTAGHSLGGLWPDSRDLEDYDGSSSTYDDSDAEDPEADKWVTEADMESNFGEDSETTPIWSSDQRGPAEDIAPFPEPKCDIGMIVADSLRCPDNEENHDWALIKVERKFWAPNCINTLPHSPDPTGEHKTVGTNDEVQGNDGFRLSLSSSKLPISLSEQCVVVITPHGLQRGTLSASLSYLLMPPGRTFVETLDFSPDHQSKLKLGDSGSWVVNEATGEVYGHVVSTDALGEAYVMPIQSTLLAIQTHLHAREISLPTMEEVSQLQHSVPSSPDPETTEEKIEVHGTFSTEVPDQKALESTESLTAQNSPARRLSYSVDSSQASPPPKEAHNAIASTRRRGSSLDYNGGTSTINPEAQVFKPLHATTMQHHTGPYNQFYPQMNADYRGYPYSDALPPTIAAAYPRQGTDSGYQTMTNTPQASPQASGQNSQSNGSQQYTGHPQHYRGPPYPSHSPPYTPPYAPGPHSMEAPSHPPYAGLGVPSSTSGWNSYHTGPYGTPYGTPYAENHPIDAPLNPHAAFSDPYTPPYPSYGSQWDSSYGYPPHFPPRRRVPSFPAQNFYSPPSSNHSQSRSSSDSTGPQPASRTGRRSFISSHK